MPIPIEKVQATGLNTDVAPDAIEKLGGGRKVVNPILDCLNKHYVSSDNGSVYKIENVNGNVLKTITLASGTNKSIGAFEDYLNNQVINWVYNSNGNHCVIAYNPETDTLTYLLQNKSALNFQANGTKISAGVVGKLLYWSDGVNDLRVINMTRSYSYTGFDISHITLIKIPPYTKPIIGNGAASGNDPRINRVYDSSIDPLQNRIYDKNFQFCYRFKYFDNEYSVTSPFSDVSYGEYYPLNFSNPLYELGQSYNYGNKIQVIVVMPDASILFIKQVEVLVRENNTGNWKIWRIFKNNEFINSGVTTTPLSDYFTNTESLIDVDQSETSKISESIPNFSKALCIQKNRVFCVDDEEGFDIQDNPPTLDLSTFSYTFQNIAAYTNAGYSVLGTISTGFSAASNTSFTIAISGHTPPTFTLTTASAYAGLIGARVTLKSGSTIYASGTITAVNSSTSISIKIDVIYQGSGSTFSSWTISGVIDNYKTYWKSRGIFVIGLAVFDAQMRPMGVISKSTIKIPDAKYNGSSPAQFLKDNLLNVTINGSLLNTPKAKYYSLCTSSDQFYETHHSSFVEVLFYFFDVPPNYSGIGGQYIYNGMSFDLIAPNDTISGVNRYIYFRIPKEFPITLDNTWKIHPTSLYKYFDGNNSTLFDSSVISISGDVVKTKTNFGIGGSSGIMDYRTIFPFYKDTNGRRRYFMEVEFYKQSEPNNLFYEFTDRYPIDVNGVLSKTTFSKLLGPTFLLPKLNLNFDGWSDPVADSFYGPFLNDVANSKANFAAKFENVESLTHIGSNSFSSEAIATIFNVGSQSIPIVKLPIKSIISDYQKSAWNQGKIFSELQDKTKVARTSVIRFSNPYVQDTQINGLSSFDSGNQHTVSLDRGPIIRLVPLSNNILAVHTRASTTLYTEEGLLRAADDGSTLIKTSDVIGHDRALQGKYGSYNPESIASLNDMAFGWDLFNAVVWQYTVEGMQEISAYGMREYFRQKQLLIMSTGKDNVKVYGEIDPFHHEYIISFVIDGTHDETIAYNYQNNIWTTRYSFIPEMTCRINKSLVTFKNGQLWLHGKDSANLNRFYATNYPALIKIAVNPHPTKNKSWLALQLSAQAIPSATEFKVIELTNENGQYSYLKPDDFEKLENVYYSDILKDENTQSDAVPAGRIALRDGDDMRSKYLIVQINEDVAPTKNSTQQLNVTYTPSEYSD